MNEGREVEPARHEGRELGLTAGRMGAGMALCLILALAGCDRKVILAGERFPVRAPLEDSIPTEAAPAPVAPPSGPVRGSAPISLPAPVANADWPQRGGNARHAAPHAALSAAPRVIWSADLGEGSSRRIRISVAPVVAGGRVFAMDAAGAVSAVSTSGALLWRTDPAARFDRGSGASGGGLAAEGDRLFVNSAYGEVVALDAASGAVLWRQRLDAAAQGAPAVADGVVYVSGSDGWAWAIDAGDGKVIWQVAGTPGSSGYLGGAAPAVGDRSVIFPSAAGDLTAVLKIGGGTRAWQQSVAGRRLGRAYAFDQAVTGDPVLAGGVVYAGTAAGRVIALKAGSGEVLWTAAEGAMGPIAVAGGSLFLLGDEAMLARLDAATGRAIWEVQLPYFTAAKVRKHKAVTAHYGPLVAGGRLWVASGDGFLRSFDPTDGTLVGSVELPAGAAAQPALAGGTLYIVTERGQLLALR